MRMRSSEGPNGGRERDARATERPSRGGCAAREVGTARRGGQDISRKSARCRNSALRRLGVGVCVVRSPPLASPKPLTGSGERASHTGFSVTNLSHEPRSAT
jgi:hypothetical protein